MLRSEIIELLKSGLEVLNSSTATPEEKVSGMKKFFEDAIEETVYGVTLDHVRKVALEKVSVGKEEHIKVALRLLGAKKLADLEHSKDELAALLAMIKIF
jgi:N-acyl-D-aspartate/D-glutamate deacylase